MNDDKDELYQVFEDHLCHFEDDNEDQAHFVKVVVDRYWLIIQERGFVPSSLYRQLRSDLEQEVAEMLQKKIYGYFSLNHYRRQRRSG